MLVNKRRAPQAPVVRRSEQQDARRTRSPWEGSGEWQRAPQIVSITPHPSLIDIVQVRHRIDRIRINVAISHIGSDAVSKEWLGLGSIGHRSRSDMDPTHIAMFDVGFGAQSRHRARGGRRSQTIHFFTRDFSSEGVGRKSISTREHVHANIAQNSCM